MKNSTIGVALVVSLQVTQISGSPVAARDSDWPVCVWPGWDTHESFWSSTDGTYPACSAACFSQPNCKSFAFAKGDCNLYDINVQSNINWNLNSPYYFYDRRCEVVNQKCNVMGYQAKFNSYFWSNTLTYDQCTSACVSDGNCKSWAYGSGECYLYDVPTVGNIGGPGNYRWSDIGCVKPSTTASSTTATTTSTTIVVPGNTSTITATAPVIISTMANPSAATITTKASTTATTTKKSSSTKTKTTTTKTTTKTTTIKATTTTTKKAAATSASSST